MYALNDLNTAQYLFAGTSPIPLADINFGARSLKIGKVDVFLGVLTPAAVAATPKPSMEEMAIGLGTQLGTTILGGLMGAVSAGLGGVGTKLLVSKLRSGALSSVQIKKDITFKSAVYSTFSSGWCIPFVFAIEPDGELNLTCQGLTVTQGGSQSYGYIFRPGSPVTIALNSWLVGKTFDVWVR
jgi:hypothetical protein